MAKKQTKAMIEAELRLFKAYTIRKADETPYNTVSSVEKGLLYTTDVTEQVKNIAETMYGIKPEEWNNTFHKSFQTVIDTPIEKLIAQQIIHYFTTYGLESAGLFDNDLVYIPHEKLEIPELEEDIKLTLLQNLTEEQLSEKLMSLLTSGIALSKQTVEDIMVLSDYLDKDRMDEIKNKEIRIALFDKYDIFPKNNMDFLRYVVFKATGKTLYIQSKDMLREIKHADRTPLYVLFNGYISKPNGSEQLAEIFLRNKNIFLAFKTPNPTTSQEKALNNMINQISKKTAKCHKPLTKGVLDKISAIKTMEELTELKPSILKALDSVPVFMEIRILNGLKYRLVASDTIVYRLRNGKVFTKEMDKVTSANKLRALQSAMFLVYDHLTKRLEGKFKDKTFYIPEYVKYTVPTSEKQFYGDIPEGSMISIPRTKSMVVGVHWEDTKRNRVDLDLKLVSKSGDYGWNTSYYSDDHDIVFSGDMTSAPKPDGATEVFLISSKVDNKSFLLTLNDFTQVEEEVPFEFFVATHDKEEIGKSYVVNPNNVKILLHNKFEKRLPNVAKSTKNLGYVEITDKAINIYFKNYESVKGRVNNPSEINTRLQNYTDLYNQVQLSLNELITECGGKLSNTKTSETLEEVVVDNETLYKKVTKVVDYDLDMSCITKDTLINLLGGQ